MGVPLPRPGPRPHPGSGDMLTSTPGSYLFMAPDAASTPSPIMPPKQDVACGHDLCMRRERAHTVAVALRSAADRNVVLALRQDDIGGGLNRARADARGRELAHCALHARGCHRDLLLGAFDDGRATSEKDGNHAAYGGGTTQHSRAPQAGFPLWGHGNEYATFRRVQMTSGKGPPKRGLLGRLGLGGVQAEGVYPV